MIHKPVLTTIFLLSFTLLQAQTTRYIISLRDKANNNQSLAAPEQFLSTKAIERRTKQHITIDSTDLPVSAAYLDSISAAGNVKILYTSRWFNQVIIQTTDMNALNKIQSFSFVGKTTSEGRKAQHTGARIAADEDYGNGTDQIDFHNGKYLHEHNYKGQNMLIAVFDGGFPKVDANRAFAYLRSNNLISGTWDFTNAVANVYDYDAHGAECLSILAANLPGEMIGTAPEASYLLLRTEESETERPIEENNWVAAAEYADSMGAAVISSSVGYNTFDDPAYDHTYADLDGKTTIIARAATMAARKGMIVVSAAGNEGITSWKTLLTPGDADSILTVGAVNSAGAIANFSGRGPSADGRIKPDVVSYGVGTKMVATNGEAMTGSGTSFATPIIAGLTACLWQAFPNSTNMQIINAIRESSTQYNRPDNASGYGIPDFQQAFNLLLASTLTDSTQIQSQLQDNWLKALPNPFSSEIKTYMHVNAGQKVELALIDNSGRLIVSTSFTATANYFFYQWPADFSRLSAGIYYLRAQQGKKKTVVKLVRL